MTTRKEDETTRMLFAERLNMALRRKNITITELGKRTGIHKADISNYRHGRYIPKQSNVFKLALALDVSPVWLWGMTDDPHINNELEYLWSQLHDSEREEALSYMRYLLLRSVTHEEEG